MSARAGARGYGPWVAGFSQGRTLDGGAGFGLSAGTMAGLDVGIGPDTFIGASFGSSFTDAASNVRQAVAEIDGFTASLYGSHFIDARSYVDAVLTFGENSHANLRAMEIDSLARLSYSEHDSQVVSASIEAGRVFDVGGLRPEVFGSLQYSAVKEDGFSEIGSLGVNLIVDEREIETLESGVGMRMGYTVETAAGTLKPEISVAWMHDFGIDNGGLTARFADAPDRSFTIPGDNRASEAIRLRGALNLLADRGYTVSATIDGELRDGETNGTALLNFGVKF